MINAPALHSSKDNSGVHSTCSAGVPSEIETWEPQPAKHLWVFPASSVLPAPVLLLLAYRPLAWGEQCPPKLMFMQNLRTGLYLEAVWTFAAVIG